MPGLLHLAFLSGYLVLTTSRRRQNSTSAPWFGPLLGLLNTSRIGSTLQPDVPGCQGLFNPGDGLLSIRVTD
ncbi:hypothetical protein BDP81DRAFT_428737 [Colletotrichum phormii]|uniref:Secreted protein n=1 Tax=Colletotrichum phormii TaxID=359342 RepID=A0AAI9ZPR7_9PEZI|nr:uncharacterized protein BDP81DRAFT_428737 [Colletotrichum phormii]KAK1635937.1 hypothetical protein BDP81DRAFT_428737 [Colletotrichum phormii]